MKNIHIPVLLKEVIEYLNPKAGQRFIDCTLGGGGYTLELLKRGVKVLAIDLDEKAINNFKRNKEVEKYQDNLILVHDNFANLKIICDERVYNKINGIVLDLGLSSNQLQDEKRGFSFQSTGALDMRFDPRLNQDFGGQAAASPLTAFEIINKYKVEKLNEIFSRLGEETLAWPLSKTINEIRQRTKISTPKQLAEIVSQVYKKHFKKPSRIHPATKVFQALRLEVNQELVNLEKVLPVAIDLLSPDGSLAVVSFHSLEDRIVKHFFRQESKDCLCPKEFPICKCGHRAKIKIITKKPVVAGRDEVKSNPRSRSAKMRVAKKLDLD